MCYHKANRILCQLETLTIQGNVKVTPKQLELFVLMTVPCLIMKASVLL